MTEQIVEMDGEYSIEGTDMLYVPCELKILRKIGGKLKKNQKQDKQTRNFVKVRKKSQKMIKIHEN